MNKFENLSNKKKVFVFLLLLLIFSSLFYLSTIDKITIIEYKHDYTNEILCTEKYINNKIDGEYCPQNSKFNHKYKDIQWQPILNKS